MINTQTLLERSFAAAVAAADPLQIVAAHLPRPGKEGRTVVVGAGKAGASMALAVDRAWPANAPLSGLVVTRYAHGYAQGEGPQRVKVVEASHPVPDAAGAQAAADILQIAKGLSSGDLLIALISGGGSSLLSLPAAGLSMDDLRAVTQSLLACGAPIEQMNVVRKHLSAIAGGRLAAATKARVLALLISDVAGDDPSAIASGPCVPDPSTYADAQAVIAHYGVSVPEAVARHLARGAAGELAETPKPGAPLFARVENRVIATAQKSLQAAAVYFHQQGITPIVLGDTVTGEATEVAKVYAALVRQIRAAPGYWPKPMALISGGECTVTLRAANQGKGRGGRCGEFLLQLARELHAVTNIAAIACDTDGIDGSESNAGAWFDTELLARAAVQDLKRYADAQDSFGFWQAAGGLITTGPTRTNVNDYRAIVVL
ncbi:MAG: glycerate kinase type-2 family protein [Burkholderiaceae bacterium]